MSPQVGHCLRTPVRLQDTVWEALNDILPTSEAAKRKWIAAIPGNSRKFRIGAQEKAFRDWKGKARTMTRGLRPYRDIL